jgi:hypothetical protein
VNPVAAFRNQDDEDTEEDLTPSLTIGLAPKARLPNCRNRLKIFFSQ